MFTLYTSSPGVTSDMRSREVTEDRGVCILNHDSIYNSVPSTTKLERILFKSYENKLQNLGNRVGLTLLLAFRKYHNFKAV